MPITVIAEGDVDRAILKALAPELDVPKPKTHAPGREAAIERAADATVQVGEQNIVLMLDWNHHNEAQLIDEVTNVLKKSWGRDDLEASERRWSYDRQRDLRLITAGLPHSERLKRWKIDSFMADDYLLELCLHNDALEAFCDGEGHLTWTPKNAAAVENVLGAVAKTFQEHGITLSSSKRYVHLFKAAIGFEAARATFAEKLVKRAPQARKEEVLGDLRRQLLDHEKDI